MDKYINNYKTIFTFLYCTHYSHYDNYLSDIYIYIYHIYIYIHIYIYMYTPWYKYMYGNFITLYMYNPLNNFTYF